MKLLIITQAVDLDNPALGFFHRWILEFSKHCTKVTVICLEKGDYDLPANVKILSLGKETGRSRVKYLWRFYKYLWQERANYDKIFVHMNPIYLVLAGWWWRATGKKAALWYTHREVDLRLRLAEKFADVIFTAAKESFRLPSRKLRIVGHGIPVDDFARPSEFADWRPGGCLRLISVGRISPIKNLDILIQAAGVLRDRAIDFKISLVGDAVTAGDRRYLERLKAMIQQSRLGDRVAFLGAVSPETIRKYYWASDLSLNLAPTGGVDKAGLESMAAGVPVLASNLAFADYFGRFSADLICEERDAADLADKINRLAESPQIAEIKKQLLSEVKKKSDLPDLINKIVERLK